MVRQVRGSYITQFANPGLRKGKWMTAADRVLAPEAYFSVKGILGIDKAARLLVQVVLPKSKDDPKPILHTLVVREWNKYGVVVYENKSLASTFDVGAEAE